MIFFLLKIIVIYGERGLNSTTISENTKFLGEKVVLTCLTSNCITEYLN